MSGSSRDYYHYPRGTTLPPIRDVIGDVLEQPAIPRTSSPAPRSQTPTIPAHATPSSRPLYLPPLRPPEAIESSRARVKADPHSARDYHMQSPSPPPSHMSHNYDRSGTSSSTRGDYRMHSPSPVPAARAGGRMAHAESSSRRSHSYDVFVATSDQGLVHKRSSTNDDFHQVTKEDVIANSTGKHVCSECQRRFEKLSTLKNHLTTHTGERPHECPDCGKTFSVYTNMRRHQLIHRRTETS